MTGSSTIAYQHEPVGDYLGSPTMAEYIVPGANLSVQDLTLSNAVARMDVPNQAAAVDAVAGNFEGAIGIQGTLTSESPWLLNHVYGDTPTAGGESSAPYTYTWTPRLGRAQSSRWYIGVNHLDGTSERIIKGAVFPQLSLSINVGEEVTFSATGFYGDEQGASSITPGTITGKDADPMMFHGGSLEIPNSTQVVEPQEGTLDLQTNIRDVRTWARKPVDAAMGSHEPSLSLSKIITGTSMRTLAYGNSSAPATSVDGAATGTLRFDSAGTGALEAQMSGVTPDEYNWTQVANKDEDSMEDIQFTVNAVDMMAESSHSSAL